MATLIVVSFIAWMVVSPDRVSLAATRGAFGAARGFTQARRAKRAGFTTSSTGKATPSAGASPWRGALAGWREGVAAARARRVAGRDVWSRGTRLAGKAWGGGENIVAGVRRIKPDLAAWRARRAAKKGNPVVAGEVIDPDPTTADGTTAGPTYGPQPDDGSNDNGFRHHIADPDDPAWSVCGAKHPAPPLTTLLTVSEHGGLSTIATCRECCPLCWARLAAKGTGPGSDVVKGEVVTTTDQAADAAGGAPSEGEGAPSTTTNTIVGELADANKEITNMGMTTTELANVDEVEAEVTQVEQAIEGLVAALSEVRAWAQHLPERWEASEWSTEGLDKAIAGVPESFGVLTQSDTVLEQLAAVRAEIANARNVGEIAAEHNARGKVDGFVPA